MNARPTKEPIRRPGLWIVLALIMLAAIPWYLPKGTLGFVLLGIPYWMFISVAFTLVMCGYVSWLCFTQWDVIEGEEESGASESLEDTPSENGKG